VTFHVLFLLFAGFLALLAGAEGLVRGAARLAILIGVPPLVIGLTVVAYGTSAPEMAVSLSAAWMGQPDLAVGNVVGSNIFNVLAILGLAALAAPLRVARQLIRLDAPLMLLISFFLLALAFDGRIGRMDGALLAAGGVFYTFWAIREGRRESAREAAQSGATGGGSEASVAAAPPLRESFFRRVGAPVLLIAAGLALLVLGARWLTQGAVLLARGLGVSELVIGLTIVAAGTSLPELATSVVASLRGQRDIAVGNIVGSNIFNILIILGFTGALAPAGIQVARPVIHFDLPVMIAAAAACLPVFFTRGEISRWEGGLFLGYYCAYVVYLILRAARHDALEPFSQIMALFVIPITVLTLVLLTVSGFRERRAKRPAPPPSP